MKNLLPLKSLLSFALLVCSTNISANKIISVSDFGLKPDSRINAVPFVQKAINACKQHPGSTLEPNIVKHQSDYQILILGIVW